MELALGVRPGSAVQVKVKVVCATMPIDCLTVCGAQADLMHDQLWPLVPETMQETTLVALHFSVTGLPLRTRTGFTVRDMIGAGGGLQAPFEQP